ncbi:MAG: PilZ domain-containing protein [Deltaproteobacteria bacterium]|nr:PilZ domain-containing protein [Deltaproteobacteria bacterium]
MTSERPPVGGSRGGSRNARRLNAPFSSYEEFLEARLDVQPAGLFLAGKFDLEVGEDVVAHCSFPGDADAVRLNGRVLWRRLRGGTDRATRPGLGVLLRTSSLATFRRLVEHAEGRSGLAGRGQERFPARFSATCTFGNRQPVRTAGEVSDVSLHGAAVRVAHRPSVGDPVFVQFDDRLLGRIELSGFVSWVRPLPGIGPNTSSIGVELRFVGDDARQVWERIVGRARAEIRLHTEYSGD